MKLRNRRVKSAEYRKKSAGFPELPDALPEIFGLHGLRQNFCDAVRMNRHETILERHLGTAGEQHLVTAFLFQLKTRLHCGASQNRDSKLSRLSQKCLDKSPASAFDAEK